MLEIEVESKFYALVKTYLIDYLNLLEICVRKIESDNKNIMTNFYSKPELAGISSKNRKIHFLNEDEIRVEFSNHQIVDFIVQRTGNKFSYEFTLKEVRVYFRDDPNAIDDVVHFATFEILGNENYKLKQVTNYEEYRNYGMMDFIQTLSSISRFVS